jgi:hypothetical protein
VTFGDLLRERNEFSTAADRQFESNGNLFWIKLKRFCHLANTVRSAKII